MRGMMTVYFFSTISPYCAAFTNAVQNLDRMQFLKGGNILVQFNELCQRRSVELLRNKYGVEWTAKRLHIRYAIRVDGKPVSPS